MKNNLLKILIIRFSSFLLEGNRRSKTIFYHDIHSLNRYTFMSTDIKIFEQHINIIRENGYEIVSRITKPYNQIEIHFDDGFYGIYDNINCIKDLHIPINIFIVPSYLETNNYLSTKDLVEMSSYSNINIGSHTLNHRILNEISEKQIVYELAESKKQLENMLGSKVTSLVFPEGKFNDNIAIIARDLGYLDIYSSIPGYYYDELNYGVRKRSLVQFAQEKELYAIIRGGDHILSNWYKYKHYY